jgi:hypothetical protein
MTFDNTSKEISHAFSIPETVVTKIDLFYFYFICKYHGFIEREKTESQSRIQNCCFLHNFCYETTNN